LAELAEREKDLNSHISEL